MLFFESPYRTIFEIAVLLTWEELNLDLFMRAEQAEEQQKNTDMLFKIQSYKSINNSEYHENWPVSMFMQIPKTKSKPDSYFTLTRSWLENARLKIGLMKDKRDFQNYLQEAELKISVLTLFHFLTT